MPPDESFDELLSEKRPLSLRTPETRVDAAHVRADAAPNAGAAEEPMAAQPVPADASPGVTAQQVRLQAAQLASHLQRQQSTVDHRESELNARSAAVENQIRAARLWLDERHAEVAAQKAELDRRERELVLREKQLKGRAGRPPSTDRREAALGGLDLETDETSLDQLHRRGVPSAELRYAADSSQTYRQNLERAETLLAEQQAELEQQRRALAESRAALAESMKAERQKLADERSRFGAQRDRSQQELQRRGDELAARSAALERLRSDVGRAQTEALELRLATEELWNRLCGSMAPAEVTRSLAQTRLKLAEEHRLARSELAAEREEIRRLAHQVAEQHDKLVAERAKVQEWVRARNEELERYAAQLSSRERELADQRAACDEKAASWQHERFQLEQEIRRLLREAGARENVAAA